jgi:hypothetical protein
MLRRGVLIANSQLDLEIREMSLSSIHGVAHLSIRFAVKGDLAPGRQAARCITA